MERLRRSLQQLRARASRTARALRADWQLAAAIALALGSLLVAALVVPDTFAGGLAALGLVAAAGAGLAWALSSPRVAAVPRWVWSLLAYAAVAYVAHFIFKDIWAEPPVWKKNDWGTHHAITQALVDGLRGGGAPTWVHDLTTGEFPFDLYPSLPYHVAARLALWLDLDVQEVLVELAIAVHVATALGTTRLALRLVPWPLAVVAGLLFLFDRGAGGVSGGWMGVLFWGVFHNAVAQCFWVFALGSLIDALQRPRLRTWVLFWILATVGTVAHPIGLLFAAATAVALAAAALLARDLPPRRSLVGLVHVGLAVAVTAGVWMPLFERLLLYAVHYGNDPVRIDELVTSASTHWPAFSQLGAATSLGLLGAAVGIFSRRAVVTVLAVLAGGLIIGATDQVYLLLHTGPSEQMARFSPERLLALAKAPLFVCAVYLLARLLARVREQWPGRWRLVGGALALLLLAWFGRGVRPFVDDQIDQMQGAAENAVDPDEMRELMKWARERARDLRPDAYARLLQVESKHEIYHVPAQTDLPAGSTGGVANLFLRERIEDALPASLKRFNVRWVIRPAKSPAVGDPATEQRIGSYRVREVLDWDGRFARVERGAGDALVTRLDNRGVDVELRGTDAPALVALGTGYYPRWRARHQDGRELPVYAFPSRPDGQRSVVAAWLPPGRTTFTPDGELPSDGKGLLWTVLAVLGMAAITVVWSVRRLRLRLLRRAARWRRRLRSWRPARWRTHALVGAGLFALVLVGTGLRSSCAPTRSLGVGSGLASRAQVHGRAPSRDWTECEYRRLEGIHRCGVRLQVRDVVVGVVNDSRHSWPFQAPGIRISTLEDVAEFRIRIPARLAGTYWVAADGGPVEVGIEGESPRTIQSQTELTFDAGDERRRVTLKGKVKVDKPIEFTFVHQDDLEPERDYPVAPETPPAAVSGPR